MQWVILEAVFLVNQCNLPTIKIATTKRRHPRLKRFKSTTQKLRKPT